LLSHALAERCYVVDNYTGILAFNPKTVHLEISLKRLNSNKFIRALRLSLPVTTPQVFLTHILSGAGYFETGLRYKGTQFISTTSKKALIFEYHFCNPMFDLLFPFNNIQKYQPPLSLSIHCPPSGCFLLKLISTLRHWKLQNSVIHYKPIFPLLRSS